MTEIQAPTQATASDASMSAVSRVILALAVVEAVALGVICWLWLI